MDDSDDKIRRNLVVVSSGICLSAWLELPGSLMLGNFISTTIVVPQYKLWAVGFTLLAYLGMRFRFSGEGVTLVADVNKAVNLARNASAWQDVTNAAWLYSRPRGYVSPVLVGLGDAVSSALRKVESVRPELSEYRPTISFGSTSSHTDGLIADAVVTVVWVRKDGGYTSATSDHRVKFDWQGWRRSWLEIRAISQGWFYSDMGVQKLAPVLIALFAVSVLWYRVIATILQG